jgi:uncharacterized protein YjiS (DUF1127 family)
VSDRTFAFSGLPVFQPAQPVWQRAARVAWRMFDAVRTRRILAELDPRLLKDIGVSRGDAVREAARLPWDY